MPDFSPISQARLATCHPDLRRLFEEVSKWWPCTVLEGERTLAQQEANVAKGVSKTLESKHLKAYSRYPAGVDAVDVAPYPLKWPQRGSPTFVKDTALFYYFAGFVLGVASQMGVKLRHGGDWDGDRDIHDQSFDDLPHFELRP